MATTGFWPVYNHLKETIDYAEKPDKTIDRKFLDDDLWQALQYVENSEKTDKTMYVSAINCPKQKAYDYMMRTKRRFHETGKIVGYHGYQSFAAGEVTPEEAHRIGLETAKRMWGDQYEVVVTTHLNTENLHNHFCWNSTSFITGKKYRNQIADHKRLREISDAVCLEHNKSVLKNAPFYGGEKGAYWIHKNGGKTHRDILRENMELCLREAYSVKDLMRRLNAIGYECDFNPNHEHWTVRAVDWARAVRIDKLGYTKEQLANELNGQKLFGYSSFNAAGFYLIEHPVYKPKIYPINKILKEMEYELDRANGADAAAAALVAILFLIMITIIQLTREQNDYKPRTPGLRKLITEAPKIEQKYRLLIDNHISSMQELFYYHDGLETQIKTLEVDRQKLRNRIRRCDNEEEKMQLKQQAKDVTKQLTPLREQNKITDRIERRAPELQRMLVLERDFEIQAYTQQKNQRNNERNR
ncbi:MAG: relaxase/mobilization nuclease domain-containing protein [Clostridia bacterium]|nr:relaxase/mobilization nuclease domain-containing protein [Clostridia bacterium]